uniref:Uncharacterized protein n=1 Tax=Mucochytrium quahogii TaxID=96639 RepID=A0A7S2WJS6_9STRA|mmetsp:Transcript_26371/g.57442  ORF Transcript_26371/g.57442 Transcript_26371/m.57442 type:complete len:232 (+) Transcript_26371:153-848(+)
MMMEPTTMENNMPVKKVARIEITTIVFGVISVAFGAISLATSWLNVECTGNSANNLDNHCGQTTLWEAKNFINGNQDSKVSIILLVQVFAASSFVFNAISLAAGLKSFFTMRKIWKCCALTDAFSCFCGAAALILWMSVGDDAWYKAVSKPNVRAESVSLIALGEIALIISICLSLCGVLMSLMTHQWWRQGILYLEELKVETQHEISVTEDVKDLEKAAVHASSPTGSKV